jgi:hypothetical protein
MPFTKTGRNLYQSQTILDFIDSHQVVVESDDRNPASSAFNIGGRQQAVVM